MYYRKFMINDDEYKYAIGKKSTKILGVSKKYLKILDNETDFIDGIITPKMIRDIILEGEVSDPNKYFHSCSCKNKEKSVRALPYDVEIHSRNEYMYICEDCYNRNADDI